MLLFISLLCCCSLVRFVAVHEFGFANADVHWFVLLLFISLCCCSLVCYVVFISLFCC